MNSSTLLPFVLFCCYGCSERMELYEYWKWRSSCTWYINTRTCSNTTAQVDCVGSECLQPSTHPHTFQPVKNQAFNKYLQLTHFVYTQIQNHVDSTEPVLQFHKQAVSLKLFKCTTYLTQYTSCVRRKIVGPMVKQTSFL